MNRFLMTLGLAIFILPILTSCGKKELSPCDRAFSNAANVSTLNDTHQDLFPAYTSCSNLDEWVASFEKYPDAIDLGEPIVYATSMCSGFYEEIGKTPICQAIQAPPPLDPEGLALSRERGLSDIPIPNGAVIIESIPGEPGGREPSESYSIDASAEQIMSFFEQQMPRNEWIIDSSFPSALFYRKGTTFMSITTSPEGGSFSLMGD